MRDPLNRLKQATDLHTSTFTQAVAFGGSQPDFMDHHLKAVRLHYRTQRDLMLAAIAREFPSRITVTKPEGGMFLWITLPEDMDTEALLPERGRARCRVRAGSCVPPRER